MTRRASFSKADLARAVAEGSAEGFCVHGFHRQIFAPVSLCRRISRANPFEMTDTSSPVGRMGKAQSQSLVWTHPLTKITTHSSIAFCIHSITHLVCIFHGLNAGLGLLALHLRRPARAPGQERHDKAANGQKIRPDIRHKAGDHVPDHFAVP